MTKSGNETITGLFQKIVLMVVICGRMVVRLSDRAHGCDQKTAVGSSVLACDQQGPLGQTPARQSYPQSVGEIWRERWIWKESKQTLVPFPAKQAKSRNDSRRRLANAFVLRPQTTCFRDLNAEVNFVFNSELCGNGFGRIPFFFL